MDLDKIIEGKVRAHVRGLPRLDMIRPDLIEVDWDALAMLGAIPSPWHRHETHCDRLFRKAMPAVRDTGILTKEVYDLAREFFGYDEVEREEVIDLLPWGERPLENYHYLCEDLAQASSFSLADDTFFARKQVYNEWTPKQALIYLTEQAAEMKTCPWSRLRTRVQAEGLLGTDEVEPELEALKGELEDSLHLPHGMAVESLKALSFYSKPHLIHGFYRVLTPLIVDCLSPALRDEQNSELLSLMLMLTPPKGAIGLWHDTIFQARDRLSPDHLDSLGEFPPKLTGSSREDFDVVWAHFEPIRRNNSVEGESWVAINIPFGK